MKDFVRATPILPNGEANGFTFSQKAIGGTRILLVDDAGHPIVLNADGTGTIPYATNIKMSITDSTTVYSRITGLTNSVAALNSLVGVGGEAAETRIKIPYQKRKTDQELIDLFGVVTQGNTINVSQTSVIYDVLGTYPVNFSFDSGSSITCYVEIVPQFTFETKSLRKYTKTIYNVSNFAALYPKLLDFSDFTVNLNGASTPLISGNKHEWISKPLSDLDKVTITFNNISILSTGKQIKCTVSFIDYSVYPTNPSNQKWGFDVINGVLVLKQSGFTNIEAKFEFRNEDDDIIYLNVSTRVDNVHYAKMVGSDRETTEFFTSPDTLLKGALHKDNVDSPLFIASRYEGDTDVLGADNIALGIVKQDTSSFTICFGKAYTGSVNTDYSLDNYMDLPFITRVQEVHNSSADTREPQKIFENNTLISIPSNDWVTLQSIPKAEFTLGKSYNIDAEIRGTISTQGTYVFRAVYKSIDNLTTVLIPETQKNYSNIDAVFLSPPQILKPYILNDNGEGTVEFQMRKNTSSGTGATVLYSIINVYNK